MFGAVEASIVDASDTTEDGKLDFKVQAAGTLTSMAAITAANVTLGSRPILPTHTPASATAAGTTGKWRGTLITSISVLPRIPGNGSLFRLGRDGGSISRRLRGHGKREDH